MKKITFIQTSYSTLGGIETWSKGLGRYFASKGGIVSYLCAYEKTQAPVTGFEEKISLNIFVKLYKFLNRAYKIRSYIKKEKPTHLVVSVDNMIISTSLALMSISKNMRPKAFAVIHQQISTTSFVNRFLLAFMFRFVKWDAYVGVSQGITLEIQEKLPKKFQEKAICIYNFKERVDTESEKDELYSIFENQVRSSCSNLIISVGRLAPIKGYKRLIDSWSNVVLKKPDSKLVIIGEGSERGVLEELIYSQKLNKSVYLLGERKNVFPYIALADAYVCSSYSESFGLSIVQAMSLGKPVVSIDCDFGPREIFGFNKKDISTYPYKTVYGYLANEQTLAQNLIQIMEEKQFFSSDHIKERSDYFSLTRIAQSWDRLM